jgi:hypothetical protein
MAQAMGPAQGEVLPLHKWITIQVFIAQSRAVSTLLGKLHLRVVAARLAATITECSGCCPGQAHRPVNLRNQADSGITSDVTTTDIGFNFTAFNGWKFERALVTLGHGGIYCC